MITPQAASRIPVFAVAWLAFAPAPVQAHHTLANEFDRDSSVTLTGTIAQMHWVIPHSVIVLDVTNDDGVIEHWHVQFDASGTLMRRGWTRATIPVGGVVTLTGYKSLDGSKTTYGRTITLSSGAVLQASSEDELNWRRIPGKTGFWYEPETGDLVTVNPY